MPLLIAVVVLVGVAAYAIYQAQSTGAADTGTPGGSTDMTPATSSEVPPIATPGDGDPIAVALPLIKQFEGFSPTAYADPPEQTTTYSIGYGHQIRLGDPYNRNSTIGEAEASDVCRVDAGGAWDCIQANLPNWSDLSCNQQAALISFVYNEGCGKFAQSTMLAKLKAGDFDGAAAEFPKWVYQTVGGQKEVVQALVDRRNQEVGLFNS